VAGLPLCLPRQLQVGASRPCRTPAQLRWRALERWAPQHEACALLSRRRADASCERGGGRGLSVSAPVWVRACPADEIVSSCCPSWRGTAASYADATSVPSPCLHTSPPLPNPIACHPLPSGGGDRRAAMAKERSPRLARVAAARVDPAGTGSATRRSWSKRGGRDLHHEDGDESMSPSSSSRSSGSTRSPGSAAGHPSGKRPRPAGAHRLRPAKRSRRGGSSTGRLL